MPGLLDFGTIGSFSNSQMDPQPRKVYGGEINFDIDCLSVEEAITVLRELEIPEGCAEATVQLDCNDDYASTRVIWYRMETPAEVENRIERQQMFNQQNAQRRREQYEALRREFEGE